jgi:hypothetical protein
MPNETWQPKVQRQDGGHAQLKAGLNAVHETLAIGLAKKVAQLGHSSTGLVVREVELGQQA